MGLVDDIERVFGDAKSLYDVLGVDKTATSAEIRKAYFKLGRQFHPDKNQSADATEKFQVLSRVHQVLSDQDNRKLYDDTGLIADEDDAFGNGDVEWETYWRNLFPKITEEDIDQYSSRYKGSAEEEEDLKRAYVEAEGDMDKVFSMVILSDPVEDEARFRATISSWIKSKAVPEFPAFSSDVDKKRRQRQTKAKREAKEASEAREELKRHRKAAGLPPRKSNKSGNKQDLVAMIQSRNKSREGAFAAFAAKYGVENLADEPSEEDFLRAQEKLERRRSSSKADTRATSTSSDASKAGKRKAKSGHR